MAIYPDKKNGKLTGRWRVELQSKGRRYRERHNDLAAAKKDEERVKAAWAKGLEVEKTSVRVEVKDPCKSLERLAKNANGILWRDQASELNTWKRIERILRILPGATVDSLTTPDLDRLADVLQKGSDGGPKASDSTINRYLSHLHKLMDHGASRGYRRENPEPLVFPWREESEGRIRWLTYEEEAKLQELLPANCWTLVEASIDGGFRRGELLSLEPAQFSGNRVHLWETKTDSPRTVHMDYVKSTNLYDLVCRKQMPSESELRYQWDKAKAAMGLENDENFVFHACRHTCCTRLVESGVNLRVIQKFMGHKRIETTIRYAHVRDEMLEEASRAKSQHADNIHLRTGIPPLAGGEEGNISLQCA